MVGDDVGHDGSAATATLAREVKFASAASSCARCGQRGQWSHPARWHGATTASLEREIKPASTSGSPANLDGSVIGAHIRCDGMELPPRRSHERKRLQVQLALPAYIDDSVVDDDIRRDGSAATATLAGETKPARAAVLLRHELVAINSCTATLKQRK